MPSKKPKPAAGKHKVSKPKQSTDLADMVCKVLRADGEFIYVSTGEPRVRICEGKKVVTQEVSERQMAAWSKMHPFKLLAKGIIMPGMLNKRR